MKAIQIEGTDYERLADGRLKNLADWTPDIAIALAEEDNVALGDDHWKIIHLMRDFYQQFNISPIKKLLKKEIARKLDKELANDQHLDNLFPNGVYQATKYAGIPAPLMDSELDASSYIKPVKLGNTASQVNKDFQFNGKTIKVYPIGNLVNLDDWNEELAEIMAQRENISLTPEHWEVIRFLRQFYFRYSVTPMVKLLISYMQDEMGNEGIDRDALYQLFPQGPSRQGSRIAGLPEPQGCIDD